MENKNRMGEPWGNPIRFFVIENIYISIIKVTIKNRTKHAIDGIEVQSSRKFQKDFSLCVERTKFIPNLSFEYLL